MYKEFFGLKEQGDKSIEDLQSLINNPNTLPNLKAFNDELGKTKELMGEDELVEAELVNNITDYEGHIIYRLRDPQEAKMVAKDIAQWTNKKGFTIIEHDRSDTGLTGYFYFRLGEDPGSESQRIQGYLAQMPEIEKFIFKQPRSKQKKLK
jgi:hypothetical protein